MSVEWIVSTMWPNIMWCDGTSYHQVNSRGASWIVEHLKPGEGYVQVAGPFDSLEAAKAACILIGGVSGNHTATQ